MKFHTRALRKSASAERILAFVRASGGRQVDSLDCAGAEGGKKTAFVLGEVPASGTRRWNSEAANGRASGKCRRHRSRARERMLNFAGEDAPIAPHLRLLRRARHEAQVRVQHSRHSLRVDVRGADNLGPSRVRRPGDTSWVASIAELAGSKSTNAPAACS